MDTYISRQTQWYNKVVCLFEVEHEVTLRTVLLFVSIRLATELFLGFVKYLAETNFTRLLIEYV